MKNMKILYNIKIRLKFMIPSVITMIGCIYISYLGISGMREINSGNEVIYFNNYESTVTIQQVNQNLSEIRISCQKIVNEQCREQIDACIANINTMVEKDNALLETYESLITADKDRQLYDELLTKLIAYREARTTMIESAQAGDYTTALDSQENQIEPAVQAVQDVVDQLITFNLSDAKTNVEQAQTRFEVNVTTTIIAVVITLIIGLLIEIVISQITVKPLVEVRNLANKVADGDLTAVLSAKYIDNKDEIGDLSGAINRMKENLQQTISGIKDSAATLNEKIVDNNNILNELDQRIEQMASATQEISASMEESSASAEEMYATAEQLEVGAENVAEKAEEGAARAGEIHDRASGLGSEFKLSAEKADKLFDEIKTELEKALEESKAVDEINLLADAILGITSQTNLLALNASIEAARAGEAGKGFAVVANEISHLADSSKETASQIQDITQVVMSAVNHLSSSSNKLLNFVASDVTTDYTKMLHATDAYSDDAYYIRDMTTELNATAEQLMASIHTILETISNVNQAVQESAGNIALVAEQDNEISANTIVIVENVEETQKTSLYLEGLISSFKTE